MRWREGQTDRQRETEGGRDRQTDRGRLREGETDRQTDRQTEGDGWREGGSCLLYTSDAADES